MIDKLLHSLTDIDDESVGSQFQWLIVEVFIVSSAILLSWRWAFLINSLPGVSSPLGMANYVDVSFLFVPNVAFLTAGFISVMCILAIRQKFDYGYAIAFLALHFLYTARFGMGKVGHGSMLVGMGFFLLALATISFKDPSERRKFFIGSLFFFIGLAYTLSAASKLIGSGLTWSHGSHLAMWVSERSVDITSKNGEWIPNGLERLVLSDFRFGTLILTMGLLTECAGWLFWFKRWRSILTLALIAMHLGIGLILHIWFPYFIVLLTLVGLPLGQWFDVFNRNHKWGIIPLPI